MAGFLTQSRAFQTAATQAKSATTASPRTKKTWATQAAAFAAPAGSMKRYAKRRSGPYR